MLYTVWKIVLVWSLKMELPQLIRLHKIPHTEPGTFQPTIATVWRRILMEKIDFYTTNDKHYIVEFNTTIITICFVF